jgi:hypothetical protein
MSLPLIAAIVLAATPAPHGPTLATEDTMRTEVPEVLVHAPRVTLDEILDRVARGETHRDSLIRDQVFTLAARLVCHVGETKHAPELLSEEITKVYKKKPDHVRAITLRKWQKKPPKKESDDETVNVDFSSDTSEEIVNFAFRPENRREFRFHIAGRDLLGDHLIYRIAFEPRTTLDPSIPSGMVWVDTNDFVVVRQEVRFDRSPVPIFLKDVNKMVIERQQVDSLWVLSRVLLRATFTVSMPEVGRGIDLSLQFNDYAINHGVPDSIFTARGSKK